MGFSIVPYSPFALVRFNYGIGTLGDKVEIYQELNYGLALAPNWFDAEIVGFLEVDSGLS